MNNEIPTTISAFFENANAQNFDGFLALFTADAHLNEAGRDYQGAEIRSWIEKTAAEGNPRIEIKHATGGDEQWSVTAESSGETEGSALRRQYLFALMENKISGVVIKPEP
jgi:hypothetical protein